MKAFLGGVAAMIIIAVAAAFALDSLDQMVNDRAISEQGSVRLGDGF
jgi:hypothetical protein